MKAPFWWEVERLMLEGIDGIPGAISTAIIRSWTQPKPKSSTCCVKYTLSP
jgi:hypothetical protein